MINNKAKIVIIGGGLTGLTLAYNLKKINIDATVIEARDRLGGRIHTASNNGTIELGATWFSRQHQSVIQLLKELGLQKFDQFLGDVAIYEPISTSPHQIVQLPANDEPSYRVVGGTSRITDVLAGFLEKDQIIIDTQVQSIESNEKGIKITCDKLEIQADYVVSTLPPFLFKSHINVNPPLPNELNGVCENTHTWMGESIKVGLTYKTPFWRAKGKSGTIFSSVGPITEMYDHSSVDNKSYALKGFFNGSYFSISKEKRKQMVLDQLEKYFGKEALDYSNYEEAVWKNEKFTSEEYENPVFPHQNNGDILFEKSYLNNRLFLAGTETSKQFSGYMEGAILSAKLVFEKLRLL